MIPGPNFWLPPYRLQKSGHLFVYWLPTILFVLTINRSIQHNLILKFVTCVSKWRIALISRNVSGTFDDKLDPILTLAVARSRRSFSNHVFV